LKQQGSTEREVDAGRILDIVVACGALIVLAPLMIILAIAIKLTSPGPIFFTQTRLGLAGRPFGCLKFRTMRCDADRILEKVLANDPVMRAEWERDQKLRSDPRVSVVGRILRKTSLDELPQLFNVLAGNMSIVGPRPIVADEAARYRRHISAYCAVRPGITGLWQVSGRNHTTYRRRVACDVAYVRNKSAANDLRIMAMTVPVVLLARGAY
jgi:exopolysaccharide production protein ExoY